MMGEDQPFEGQESIVEETSVNPERQMYGEGRWELEFQDILESIMHKLRGESFNYVEDKWEKVPDTALVNEQGINALMTLIEGKVNKNITLSNFNEEQISRRMEDFVITLLMHLFMKQAEWEIDTADLSSIREMIESNVEAVYFRALYSGERKYRKATIERREIISPLQQKKEGGVLSRFKI